MTNIYVGNLSYRTTENELREMFSQYGEVQTASIVKERDTGRSKGFGFVEMADAEAAKKAIEAFNEKEIGGRPLRVNEARPREDRPQRSGSFNRGRGDGDSSFRREQNDNKENFGNRW